MENATAEEHEDHSQGAVAQHSWFLEKIRDTCHQHQHVYAHPSHHLQLPERWETQWAVAGHEQHSSAGTLPSRLVLPLQTRSSSHGSCVRRRKPNSRAQSAIVCFLQLVVSPIWLKIFLFGPLEWVWRCLTYLRWEPLRRSLAAGR